MKQVLCGDKKGYLIPKKVVDDKIIKKFGLSKANWIENIVNIGDYYEIGYVTSKPKIEKKKDCVIIKERKGKTYSIMTKKNVLMESLDLKGNISEVEVGWFEDGKFLTIYYHRSYLFDDTNLYYFFEIDNKYYYKYVCETNEKG